MRSSRTPRVRRRGSARHSRKCSPPGLNSARLPKMVIPEPCGNELIALPIRTTRIEPHPPLPALKKCPGHGLAKRAVSYAYNSKSSVDWGPFHKHGGYNPPSPPPPASYAGVGFYDTINVSNHHWISSRLKKVGLVAILD